MIPKYTIEYSLPFAKHKPVHHFSTDDPVACEEFLSELLERSYAIRAIRHEGIDIPRPEFDKMIRNAADMMVTHHICRALGIDYEEVHERFKFNA